MTPDISVTQMLIKCCVVGVVSAFATIVPIKRNVEYQVFE